MEHERMNFHPLVNTMTTGDLARGSRCASCAPTGHAPRILRCAGRSPAELPLESRLTLPSDVIQAIPRAEVRGCHARQDGNGPPPQLPMPTSSRTRPPRISAQDVHRRLHAAAGAGRFLGALVRPLQAADAGHREGGAGGRRQGQAGQDEHRRPSADRRPARHPVDPGGHRLQERPAGRRLHGRPAREPDQGLHRAPRRPARAERRRWAMAEADALADGGRRRRRGRALCRRAARRTRRMSPRSRLSRKLHVELGDLGRRRALPRHGAGRASRTTRRSPAPAPPSSWPSRRSRSAIWPTFERARGRRTRRSSGALRSGHRPNAHGEREEAADQLLEIVRRDRTWNEDGARKQLVQFFEAWGPMDADDARGPPEACRRSCSRDRDESGANGGSAWE